MSNDLIKVIAVLTEALSNAHAEIESFKSPTFKSPKEMTSAELKEQFSKVFEASDITNELAAAYDIEQARAMRREEARVVACVKAEEIHNLAQERLAKGKAKFKKPNSVKLVKKSKTTR